MQWLAVSIVASIVLTVILNLGLRIPGVAERVHDGLTRLSEPRDPARPGTRVIFPWKTMLIASLALTVAINLVLVLTR